RRSRGRLRCSPPESITARLRGIVPVNDFGEVNLVVPQRYPPVVEIYACIRFKYVEKLRNAICDAAERTVLPRVLVPMLALVEVHVPRPSLASNVCVRGCDEGVLED